MAASELNLVTNATSIIIPGSTTQAITDYYYDEVYEDEVCDSTTIIQVGGILSVVIYSVVAILSLFGNIVVIVILAKYENMKSLTNTFILNLAVSDLIFTVGLPFWAYYYRYGWTLGEPACKIVNFVFHVGFYSSGILLILMTIHRYIAVVSPSKLLSIKDFYSILASVLIWIMSIVAASPAFIFSKVQGDNSCDYKNSFWSLWGIYQQNILFVVTSLVFSFCYTQIICRLLRPTVQRRKHRTLKLIFALMLVFFVSWMPYNIVIFLRSLSSLRPRAADSITVKSSCETYSKPLDYALYISRIFAFSHCCLNPVFYVFVGVKFKNHLKRMLKGNRFRNRSNRLTITSISSGEEFSL